MQYYLLLNSMSVITSAVTKDVVKPANVFEMMAAGVLGGIVTPMVQNIMPDIPYSDAVSDAVQIVAGVAAGKALGSGMAGTIVQNGLVMGASVDLGNQLYGMIRSTLNLDPTGGNRIN